MFINLSRLKARGGERWLVGGIRPQLRLQTESSEALIGGTVLADFAIEPVTHIELNTRLIRIDGQRNACTMGDGFENALLHLARLFGDDEIVVKRNGKSLVFVDGFKGAAFCEIEGGVGDGQRATGGCKIGIYFRVTVGGGPYFMVAAFVGGFAVEVEIGVVREVDDGRLVRRGTVVDLQRVVICKCIDCFSFELPWEACVTVWGDDGELQCGIADGRGLPEAAAIAVAAMEGVAFVWLIQNELVLFAVERESTAGDTVGDTTDERTEERAVGLVFFRIVMAEHDVRHLAVLIRNKNIDDGAAHVSDFDLDTIFIN